MKQTSLSYGHHVVYSQKTVRDRNKGNVLTDEAITDCGKFHGGWREPT